MSVINEELINVWRKPSTKYSSQSVYRLVSDGDKTIKSNVLCPISRTNASAFHQFIWHYVA